MKKFQITASKRNKGTTSLSILKEKNINLSCKFYKLRRKTKFTSVEQFIILNEITKFQQLKSRPTTEPGPIYEITIPSRPKWHEHILILCHGRSRWWKKSDMIQFIFSGFFSTREKNTCCQSEMKIRIQDIGQCNGSDSHNIILCLECGNWDLVCLDLQLL